VVETGGAALQSRNKRIKRERHGEDNKGKGKKMMAAIHPSVTRSQKAKT